MVRLKEIAEIPLEDFFLFGWEWDRAAETYFKFRDEIPLCYSRTLTMQGIERVLRQGAEVKVFRLVWEYYKEMFRGFFVVHRPELMYHKRFWMPLPVTGAFVPMFPGVLFGEMMPALPKPFITEDTLFDVGLDSRVASEFPASIVTLQSTYEAYLLTLKSDYRYKLRKADRLNADIVVSPLQNMDEIQGLKEEWRAASTEAFVKGDGERWKLPEDELRASVYAGYEFTDELIEYANETGALRASVGRYKDLPVFARFDVITRDNPEFVITYRRMSSEWDRRMLGYFSLTSAIREHGAAGFQYYDLGSFPMDYKKFFVDENVKRREIAVLNTIEEAEGLTPPYIVDGKWVQGGLGL